MTWLGLLNFVVLQWFGVRLQVAFETRRHDLGARCFCLRTEAVPTLLRWIWPLTGWWSPYRWIARRP